MSFHKIILILLTLHLAMVSLQPSEEEVDESEAEAPALRAFFFIFAGLAAGGTIRALIKFFNISVPYRVMLLFVGAIVGIAGRYSPLVKKYTLITHINPHYILTTFLPVLVFKTAFCIDSHTFLRSWNQMFFLAVPGIVITSCFIGLIMMMMLGHNEWPIAMGILFGTVCSSIYPVEIVAMLKEISHAKHLSTLIEGEAMLGEATVIIMFEILTGIITEAITTWYHVLLVFARFALGGIGLGLLTGKLVAWIMGIMYTDPGNTLILTVVVAFLIYYIAAEMLYVSGVITLVVMGILASIGRTSLSGEVEKFLFHFWDMFAYIANTLVFLIVGVIVTEELANEMHVRDVAFVFVTYIVVTVSRFLNYIVMAPIVSRIGYGLTLRNMTIAVWGGLRGPLPFCLTLVAYRSKELDAISRELLIHVVALVAFTLLINAPSMPLLLKLLGLSEMPMARQVNMNNCMRFLQNRRDRTIAMLKMDRFLADANWPIVHSTTVLKHPYHINLTDSDEEDENYYMGYRTTRCPDCLREIPNEPTSKEMTEMMREARLRILKAKKISYIRQYENGMLSREGIRILTQAVETAMDTPEGIIELDGLHKYFLRQGFLHYTRRKLLNVFFKKAETSIKPPRKYWRRICYHIIVHPAFDYFIYLCIVLNVIPVTMEITMSPESTSRLSIGIKIANSFFFLIYFSEFVLKICGYSWIYVCEHGFKTYFKSYWNIFDFFILCAVFVDVIMDYMDLFLHSFNKKDSKASKVTLFTRLLRIVRLIRLLRLCKAWYPRLIKYCDSKIDKHLAFAYDIGKGFVTGEEEVSDMLIQMIDNKEIREDCRMRMETDRLAITKQLGLVQKDRPWIAITVKTRQAIRATLNNVGESIMELKVSGWVDDVEYTKLMESLEERIKYVRRKIKSVQPSPPRVLFKEVPWLADDEQIADFLYENVITKVFDEGEVVCKDGEMSDGIYIIVTGLFKLTYIPKNETLSKLMEYGALPVMDYISSTRFDEKVEDYIVSGNSIGELSFLTGRPYDCTITADTSSQAYILTHEILKAAVERNRDPVNGLESKIWKSLTVRLATTILMDTPAYQSSTQSKIRFMLERSFVPNLSNYKIFGVNDMMQDIILLEGVVVDYNTRDCYIAPCHLPRTVQRILLAKSSHMNLETTIETKLLIIPAKDVDEFDIMEREEDISEMVSTASSKCLHHFIQSRASKMKRRRKRQTMFNMTRRVKYGVPGLTSSQSVYYSRSGMTTSSLGADETELRIIRMSEQDTSTLNGTYTIANEKDHYRRSVSDNQRFSRTNREKILPNVKRPIEKYSSTEQRRTRNMDQNRSNQDNKENLNTHQKHQQHHQQRHSSATDSKSRANDKEKNTEMAIKDVQGQSVSAGAILRSHQQDNKPSTSERSKRQDEEKNKNVSSTAQNHQSPRRSTKEKEDRDKSAKQTEQDTNNDNFQEETDEEEIASKRLSGDTKSSRQTKAEEDSHSRRSKEEKRISNDLPTRMRTSQGSTDVRPEGKHSNNAERELNERANEGKTKDGDTEKSEKKSSKGSRVSQKEIIEKIRILEQDSDDINDEMRKKEKESKPKKNERREL